MRLCPCGLDLVLLATNVCRSWQVAPQAAPGQACTVTGAATGSSIGGAVVLPVMHVCPFTTPPLAMRFLLSRVCCVFSGVAMDCTETRQGQLL